MSSTVCPSIRSVYHRCRRRLNAIIAAHLVVDKDSVLWGSDRQGETIVVDHARLADCGRQLILTGMLWAVAAEL